MKLRQVDGTQGRRILIWQIVSKEFIEKTPFLKDYHLDGFGPKILYQWCRDYYEKYHDAPSSHIIDIFIAQQLTLDDDSKDYIEKLLTSLSGEWEKRREFNLDAAVDTALEFVNRKEAELLQERLKQAIEAGRVDEVQRLTAEFKSVNKDQTAGTGEDPFNDPQGWEETFANDQQEVLFGLPGAWGEFMGEQLYRESLIGILAPEKVGKSFLLMECGHRALRDGCSVALFEAGDMTKSQRYYRIAQYYTHLPRKRKLPGKDFEEFIEVQWPTSFEPGTEERRRLPNLTKELADEALKKQKRRMEKSGAKLRQAYYTTSTLTFSEVERKLGEWHQTDGFLPDVILIDYPDIMLAENPRAEVRHQENMKWKMARHLSQKFHCCVIMCTQADADSYGKEYLQLKNFSETKTKYAHVTAFIGLNKTEEDEAKHQIRLNYLMPPREGSKHPPIKILQCLECCQPYLASDWVKKKAATVVKEGEEPRDQDGNWKLKKGALARKLFKDNLEHYSFKEIAKQAGITEDRARKIRHEMVAEGELE